MAQEQRKNQILKLYPSLKFMVEDNKSFVSAVPMLFGEEFAKRAITTVDQVKAIKKLNFPSEKRVFSDTTFKVIKAVAEMQPRAAVQDTRPDRPVIQLPRTKQSRTKELYLSPNVVNYSKEIIPYLSLSTVLRSVKREKIQFTCRPDKRVQRELGPADTGSLGNTNNSGLSTTPFKSSSLKISSPTITAVTGIAEICIERDTGKC